MKQIPLYHGTDRRMVLMSKEEREKYLKSCMSMIAHLRNILTPYLGCEQIEHVRCGVKMYISEYKIMRFKSLMEERGGKEFWTNFFQTLLLLEAVLNKEENNSCMNFKYGDLYLIGDKNKAINYARSAFAGGEQGLFAYHLIQGTEILGMLHLDSPEIEQNIITIKMFAESEPQPVVLQVSNIDYDCLLLESGKPVDIDEEFLLKGFSYRYTKPYQLNLDDEVSLEYVDSWLSCTT